MPSQHPLSTITPTADRWITELHQHFFTDNKHHLSFDTLSRIEDHIRHCQLHFEGLTSRSMVFVIDHATLNYLYISPNAEDVLGYSRQTMIQNGFHWMFTLFSEHELKFKQSVMKDIYATLTQLPPAEVYKCSSRYNMEVIHADGSKRMMIEEMMYPQVSEDGMPMVTTAFVHDLNGLLPTDIRRCTIEKHSGSLSELLFEKVYRSTTSKCPLSKRELDVLALFAKGMSSQQTAERLYISTNTANVHRKNILRKLTAVSTAEAVQIAMNKNWLQI